MSQNITSDDPVLNEANSWEDYEAAIGECLPDDDLPVADSATEISESGSSEVSDHETDGYDTAQVPLPPSGLTGQLINTFWNKDVFGLRKAGVGLTRSFFGEATATSLEKTADWALNNPSEALSLGAEVLLPGSLDYIDTAGAFASRVYESSLGFFSSDAAPSLGDYYAASVQNSRAGSLLETSRDFFQTDYPSFTYATALTNPYPYYFDFSPEQHAIKAEPVTVAKASETQPAADMNTAVVLAGPAALPPPVLFYQTPSTSPFNVRNNDDESDVQISAALFVATPVAFTAASARASQPVSVVTDPVLFSAVDAEDRVQPVVTVTVLELPGKINSEVSTTPALISLANAPELLPIEPVRTDEAADTGWRLQAKRAVTEELSAQGAGQSWLISSNENLLAAQPTAKLQSPGIDSLSVSQKASVSTSSPDAPNDPVAGVTDLNDGDDPDQAGGHTMTDFRVAHDDATETVPMDSPAAQTAAAQRADALRIQTQTQIQTADARHNSRFINGAALVRNTESGVEHQSATEQANVSRVFRAGLETVAKKMDHAGSDHGGSQQQPFDWNEILRQGDAGVSSVAKTDLSDSDDGDDVFYLPFPAGDAFVG